MTKMRSHRQKRLWVLSVFSASLGCSSPGPESSSSSHWATCTSDAGCTGVRDAVACQHGYCVDDTGTRIEVTGGLTATSCDPFAAPVVSLELEEIVGAGEAADGTLYVADRTQTGERVFVETDDGLLRARVTGGGQVTSAAGEVTAITFVEPDGAISTLLIATEGGATELSLVEGNYRPGGPAPERASPLTPVEEATVRATPVAGWVDPVALEYHAIVEHDDQLVVTRPEVDWSYEDFRLFFGSGTEAIERRVLSVVRQRDGGTTNIVFELDGERAEAFFPVQGSPTLTVGDEVRSMQLAATLPGIMLPETYVCLARN